MGKDGGFLTPKAIGNRIKAKGLQKLRWYCQMCQKQCRDENGFKCHLTSESHQRQMQVFGDHPQKVIDEYSRMFEADFLEHMSMTHRTTRIKATVAYNEFIQDRHHVHMNSTKWTTLTEFIKHLGRENKLVCEETDKGWYIRLVVRDNEQERRATELKKRQRTEEDAEARQARLVAEQAERAAKAARAGGAGAGAGAGYVATELDGAARGGAALAFGLAAGRAAPATPAPGAAAAGGVLEQAAASARRQPQGQQGQQQAGRPSALDDIMRQNEAAKARQQQRQQQQQQQQQQQPEQHSGGGGEGWLRPGLVVKVVARELRDYYRKKGVVVRAGAGRREGEVEMLDSGDVLRADQRHLETVIPNVGGAVVVVRGRLRGQGGRVEGVDTERFRVRVALDAPGGGVEALEYEDVCKTRAPQEPR